LGDFLANASGHHTAMPSCQIHPLKVARHIGAGKERNVFAANRVSGIVPSYRFTKKVNKKKKKLQIFCLGPS
jgi:hypothetical protein